ncbi:MAG: nucleotidyltransferase domain-containing protein [Candidatus Helarchaeota archaeon]
MLKKLQNRKNYPSLKNYIDKILNVKNNIISIVLFGSHAKNTYSYNSGFDLFIIIENEQTKFIDRLLEFSLYSDGLVEPIVYTENEINYMVDTYHTMVLEVCADGIILYDKNNFWANKCIKIKKLIKNGIIKRLKNGWDLTQLKY